jgi:CRISPR-associated protein Csd1
MTVLQSLDGYYERMARRGEAQPPGFSLENISYAIWLDTEGRVKDVQGLFDTKGKKRVPQKRAVPAPVKRTVGIAPNLFWDKSAYVLGRTAGEGKRTAQEHEKFVERHLALLAGATDEGLVALRRFLETWKPEDFDAPPFSPEMLDANFVFRLETETNFLHDREAARRLLAESGGEEGEGAFCLVTGRRAPPQRLHPTIKGVDGAQSFGASLVSFNLEAFRSYGLEQGDNATTSQEAAFRYGAALNALLDRDRSRHRIRVADTTVVFWADASNLEQEAEAAAAEAAMLAFFEPTPPSENDDAGPTQRVREALQTLAAGRPDRDALIALPKGVRFHVLALAPNAARLAVRFWLSDDFSAFAERLAAHFEALALDPPPWRSKPPSVQRLLVKTTAVQEKFDNIPPLLAGETLRAILSGAPYPRTLLVAAIQRLRAGDDASAGWHAAVLKACLTRSAEEKPPVSLDPDNPSAAYQLGRLFRVLESAQYAALGRVNATIADRYYAAASATPARVFGPLMRNLRNHVADARKRGQGGWIEPRVSEIVARLPAELPKMLTLEDQARFAIGYYHERAHRGAAPETQAEEGNSDE